MKTVNEIDDGFIIRSKLWSDSHYKDVRELSAILGKAICGARNKDGTICQNNPVLKKELLAKGVSGEPNGRCKIHGGYAKLDALSLAERVSNVALSFYKGKKIDFNIEPYLATLRTCLNCPISESCEMNKAEDVVCQYEVDIFNNIVQTMMSNYDIDPNMYKIYIIEIAFAYIRKFRVELYSVHITDVNEYIHVSSIISKLTIDIHRLQKSIDIVPTKKKDQAIESKIVSDLAVILSKDDTLQAEYVEEKDGVKKGLRVSKKNKEIGA